MVWLAAALGPNWHGPMTVRWGPPIGHARHRPGLDWAGRARPCCCPSQPASGTRSSGPLAVDAAPRAQHHPPVDQCSSFRSRNQPGRCNATLVIPLLLTLPPPLPSTVPVGGSNFLDSAFSTLPLPGSPCRHLCAEHFAASSRNPSPTEIERADACGDSACRVRFLSLHTSGIARPGASTT